MKFKEKLESRKFWLSFMVLLSSILLLAVPPFFGQTLLDGTQFVSLVTIVMGIYISGNVIQKKITGGENGEV